MIYNSLRECVFTDIETKALLVQFKWMFFKGGYYVIFLFRNADVRKWF